MYEEETAYYLHTNIFESIGDTCSFPKVKTEKFDGLMLKPCTTITKLQTFRISWMKNKLTLQLERFTNRND